MPRTRHQVRLCLVWRPGHVPAGVRTVEGVVIVGQDGQRAVGAAANLGAIINADTSVRSASGAAFGDLEKEFSIGLVRVAAADIVLPERFIAGIERMLVSPGHDLRTFVAGDLVVREIVRWPRHYLSVGAAGPSQRI